MEPVSWKLIASAFIDPWKIVEKAFPSRFMNMQTPRITARSMLVCKRNQQF
jgi:hypothetical protein